jgi:DNA-binding PadR family transcriptional regulator
MPDEPSCPCEGQTLDRHLQPTILAILTEGPLHGYAIVERLARSPLMNGCKPDRPGVYRALNTMEDQGVVTHTWTPSQNGPSKRLYDLTSKGRTCLTKWTATLDRYRQEIAELIAMMKRAAANTEADGTTSVGEEVADGTSRMAKTRG